MRAESPHSLCTAEFPWPRIDRSESVVADHPLPKAVAYSGQT